MLQSSLLSPTANLLSSMPSEKVNARSMEGKRLRRHVLRGAVIVFVTAGYSGKKCGARSRLCLQCRANTRKFHSRDCPDIAAIVTGGCRVWVQHRLQFRGRPVHTHMLDATPALSVYDCASLRVSMLQVHL